MSGVLKLETLKKKVSAAAKEMNSRGLTLGGKRAFLRRKMEKQNGA